MEQKQELLQTELDQSREKVKEYQNQISEANDLAKDQEQKILDESKRVGLLEKELGSANKELTDHKAKLQLIEQENQILKRKLSKQQEEEQKSVHPNTTCYSCDASPIQGILIKLEDKKDSLNCCLKCF